MDKRKVGKLVEMSGLPKFLRLLSKKKGIYVPLFHGVHKQSYGPAYKVVQQPDLTISEFRDCMQWISDRFSFLSLDDVLNGARHGVLLTFDDGLLNNLVNALPVLEEFNAPAIIFTSSQHIINPKDHLWFMEQRKLELFARLGELPSREICADLFDGLGEENLKVLSQHRLIEIGGHTHTHPYLGSSSENIIQKEVIDSKEYLEKIIGQSIRTFSYPLNSLNKNIWNIVKDNYTSAFTGTEVIFGKNNHEIPRIYVHESSQEYLSLKFSGLHVKPYVTS